MNARRLVLSLLATTLGALAFAVAPALAAAPETPETGKASAVTATTAMLEDGVLNPGAAGEVGEYEYRFRVSETECEGEGSTAPEAAAGSEKEAVPAVDLTNLQPNAHYTFCLIEHNLGGEYSLPSPPEHFTTKPAPPTVASESVPSVTPFEARLEALVNPNNEPTEECEFQYGKTISYGSERACEPGALEGYGEQPVGTVVTGLQAGTTYHYRVLVKDATGSSEGKGEFTTLSVAEPVIESESASAVTASGVTLETTVNPNYQETSCEFQYGTEPLLKTGTKTVPCEPRHLGNGGAVVGAVAPLGGLEPGKPYYYRVLATNATGTTTDPTIERFETAISPQAPEGLKAEPVAATTATLNGVLNPAVVGNAGTYEFFYRESGSECQGEGEMIVSDTMTGTRGQAVDAELAGLIPGRQYTFCLLARNTAGETALSTPPVTFTTLAEPPAITGEYVTKVQETAATLNATVNPGGATTTYRFEYGPAAGSYDVSVPVPDGEIAAGVTPVSVNALATQLQPGTTYHYRILASNTQSPAGGTPGRDQTFTTPAEPGSAPETCPNAQARTEQPYGQALPDCRAYELVSPLDKGDRSAEAVDSRASVSDGPSGPEAAAVAYVSRGSFSEPGQPEPQGSRKENRYIARREVDGWSSQSLTPSSTAREAGRVAFAQLLFTPDLSQGLVFSEYVPLVKDGEPPGYNNLYVADLASSPVSYQTVSNVNPPGLPPYVQGAEVGPENPQPVGGSTELSRVVFQQVADLTPNAEGLRREHVYDWVGGKLSLVDVPPAGTTFEYGALAGAPGRTYPEDSDTWHAVSANGLRVFFMGGEQNTEGATVGVGQLYVRENPEQEQSPEPAGKCTVSSDACTVEVSASQRTGPHGEPDPDPHNSDPESGGDPYPAWYRDASADGSRVFFTSRAELTNDANTGPDDNTANLYEYELSSLPGRPGKLTDLTAPTETEDPEGAAVLGLVTASENAGEENSYVYFVANGVLAHNENANKETAQPGSCRDHENSLTGEHTCSLYVSHYSGGKWETSFIATLVGGDEVGRNDETDWIALEGGTLDADTGPGSHTVRVTPDGTTLAFESERSLTGYDNDPVEPGMGAPGHHCTERGGELSEGDPAVPCREVFVYDAVTGRLVCASCDPSGARPVGPAELGGTEFEAGNGFTPPSVYYLPRNLSEDGGRLFFQTPDALVPHDSDNQPDVYEWEQPGSSAEVAKGESSCTSSSATFSVGGGGCVFPISDVAGDFESRFMDASASGNNVFLATKDQLVPAADADARANVYDVRVGGGFPVVTAPPVCNNGDSCKPPVSPQPSIFAPAGSATFSGLGNPAPVVAPPPPKKATTKTVKCKRGFVKNKRGKCVKRKKPKKHAKRASDDRRASR
jgi:hypothetical protein